MSFVLETIKNVNSRKLKNSMIHSDQWVHYTNPIYQKLLKDLWITQSMSRRWNCIDNAPTESFFWHFKDEIDLTKIKTFKELDKMIKKHIFYYNYKRPQWNKKKMTPVQYRNHLLEK
jgi:transposase InsO family protein